MCGACVVVGGSGHCMLSALNRVRMRGVLLFRSKTVW